MFLAVAADHVYRDTAEAAWYQASVVSLNYTWNLKPALGSPGLGNSAREDLDMFLPSAAGLFDAASPASPVPLRKNLIDTPHPATTYAAARDALRTALKAAPLSTTNPPRWGDIASMETMAACGRPLANNDGDNLQILDTCAQLATSAYIDYLESGSDAWYQAARAVFNFSWNHPFNNVGWYTDMLATPAVRFTLRDRLRNIFVGLGEFREYAGQAP
jgi:hypothetical protein